MVFLTFSESLSMSSNQPTKLVCSSQASLKFQVHMNCISFTSYIKKEGKKERKNLKKRRITFMPSDMCIHMGGRAVN